MADVVIGAAVIAADVERVLRDRDAQVGGQNTEGQVGDTAV